MIVGFLMRFVIVVVYVVCYCRVDHAVCDCMVFDAFVILAVYVVCDCRIV